MSFLRAAFFWSVTWFYTFLVFLKLSWIYIKHAKYDRIQRSCAVHKLAAEWGTGILQLTPGWDYEIQGQQFLPRDGDQPMVIVANHQSAVDICALFATYTQFRWLSKASIFKIPLVGTAMKWAGYVAIERGSRRSHLEALEASAQWLRDGISMVYFPEGSRSLTGELKPFKIGAFRLAEKEGVPILPVALHGTAKMMSKNSLVPNAAKVIVSVLPPIKQEVGETCEHMMQRVRSMIEAELLLLEQGLPAHDKLKLG
ncbi:MAG: lysophospholipid acyltransferase family protein [Oligoflexus sp.]